MAILFAVLGEPIILARRASEWVGAFPSLQPFQRAPHRIRLRLRTGLFSSISADVYAWARLDSSARKPTADTISPFLCCVRRGVAFGDAATTTAMPQPADKVLTLVPIERHTGWIFRRIA